jgi:hypothetical protein
MLLNDCIGPDQNGLRDSQPYLLGGLQIDHKNKSIALLNRQVRRIGALISHDTTKICYDLPQQFDTFSRHVRNPGMHTRQPATRSWNQVYELNYDGVGSSIKNNWSVRGGLFRRLVSRLAWMRIFSIWVCPALQTICACKRSGNVGASISCGTFQRILFEGPQLRSLIERFEVAYEAAPNQVALECDVVTGGKNGGVALAVRHLAAAKNSDFDHRSLGDLATEARRLDRGCSYQWR